MIDIEKLVRPHLKNLKPYSSARDEFSGEEGIFLDANENPYGDLNRYPDPNQYRLKEEICKLQNVELENIFLGNGSDEIIDLLLRVFCNPGNDKAMIFEPTFGMYESSVRINDVEVVSVKLTETFQINLGEVKPFLSDSKLKIIFICSPNNPTGNLIDRNDIKYLLENFEGIIILDEAYIDFSSSESWRPEIENYPNLIVLQTLSKAWGMAGLRIGMAFANTKIIQYLNRIKSPYNLSSVNQKFALERLNMQQQIQEQIACIVAERKRVEETLDNCEIIKKIYPSDANFILVEVNDADKVYKALIQQKIIVRNRDKQVRNCLRITIGSPAENNQLITALKNLTI